MSTAVLERPITAKELLAMPEDGKERYVIYGKLREKPMTVRNRFHSSVVMKLGYVLIDWLTSQPIPCGKIVGGEAGICLPTEPESIVGVDAAYLSADVAADQEEITESTLIHGIPTLIAEVLSPSDTQKETHEKIKLYLSVGVPLVWILDPTDQTIRIYEPGKKPRLVNVNDQLIAEPQLPGFKVPVAVLFE